MNADLQSTELSGCNALRLYDDIFVATGPLISDLVAVAIFSSLIFAPEKTCGVKIHRVVKEGSYRAQCLKTETRTCYKWILSLICASITNLPADLSNKCKKNVHNANYIAKHSEIFFIKVDESRYTPPSL